MLKFYRKIRYDLMSENKTVCHFSLDAETMGALQTIEFQNLMFARRGFVRDIIDNIKAKTIENHMILFG